jgi:hypothetical protein
MISISAASNRSARSDTSNEAFLTARILRADSSIGSLASPNKGMGRTN